MQSERGGSISVAMCTWNGAEFLQAQLDSISAQTRRPDELVICDDRSEDATASIVERFARTAGFPVKFEINATRLGIRRNFERAIALCTSSYIALADQDDVWFPQKLARCAWALDDDRSVGMVWSDADIVEASLRPLGVRLSTVVGLDRSSRRMIGQGQGLQRLLLGNVVTGATMMFSARFLDLVLPIPPDGEAIHDAWIAILVATVAEVRYLDIALMAYRQHAAQERGLRGARKRLRASPNLQLSEASNRAVSELDPEFGREVYRLHELTVRFAIGAIEAWSLRTGAPAPRLPVLYDHLARCVRDTDPEEYSRLRALATSLDPSLVSSGTWKYRAARRLLGKGAAESLRSVQFYIRRAVLSRRK